MFIRNLDKNNFFYIPGTILHIDSDDEYIKKCENYYKKNNIKFITYKILEKNLDDKILDLIIKYEPNILVITGHDAYSKTKKKYKNSKYYIEIVKEIRKIHKSHDDLIIIAGACQSDYSGLIKSGATYASSPKNVNIHALDPAIVASYLALKDCNNEVDLNEMIGSTNCGFDGMGGLIIRGTLLKGFPRKEKM